MRRKPNRFAELLDADRLVLVTEQGVEFDISAVSLDEVLDLAFGLAVVDALPETPERPS